MPIWARGAWPDRAVSLTAQPRRLRTIASNGHARDLVPRLLMRDSTMKKLNRQKRAGAAAPSHQALRTVAGGQADKTESLVKAQVVIRAREARFDE